MIQNANIPLNAQSPTRQYPWRVGVFLGIFLLGMLFGWSTTKRIFVGFRIPALTANSGITLRLTPEHALWAQQHTTGLSLAETCPIDLPSIIAQHQNSWMVLGDTGKEEIFFSGKIPQNIKNYTSAFSCTITPTENGFFIGENTSTLTHFFPLFVRDGWLWLNEEVSSIKLNNHGLTLNIPLAHQEQRIPVPLQNLTTALPISPQTTSILSEQWQGISSLLTSNQGIAFFSWKEANSTALALTIQGMLTEEEALSLTYDLAEIPFTTKNTSRNDDTRYITTTYEPLHLEHISNTQQEVQRESGEAVAFLLTSEDYTLFSTAPTTWDVGTPQWRATMSNDNKNISYTPRTLATFGKTLFTTKNKLNILDK